MSVKRFARITTQDTKKTYELPSENAPQLWLVELIISNVEHATGTAIKSAHTKASIHLERQTLVDAGLLPKAEADKEPTNETRERPEDLILRLLEHVGVFPEQ